MTTLTKSWKTKEIRGGKPFKPSITSSPSRRQQVAVKRFTGTRTTFRGAKVVTITAAPTAHRVWSALAADALQQHRRGETIDMDDVFSRP
jgi:hypothetical protein